MYPFTAWIHSLPEKCPAGLQDGTSVIGVFRDPDCYAPR